MNRELAASYTHCRKIARSSASSFYYSFLLLPKHKRAAMCALYAFLRRTDDLGDSHESVEERRAALEAWRLSLERAVAGDFNDPLLPALVDTLTTFQIPCRHLHDAIDGVEMDLQPRRYASFAELKQYCHRVASSVGLACLQIWGCTSREADGPATDCGVAFQMTNILRDLKEDSARDRIYLPLEDLERFGYSPDDLRAGVRDDRFRELMRFEIERTEMLYAEAARLEPWLEADAQRVFGSMMAVYRALLDEIKRLDGDVLSARVSLSRWRKMRIATRWFFFPSGVDRAKVGGAMSTPEAPAVAIVGGGLAGLAAGVALGSAGCRVELFESRRWLGGRAASFRDPATGELVDHCQHVSMGCCTNLADFCRRTGMDAFFRRDPTLHFIGPDGRLYELASSSWLPAPLHLMPAFWGLKYLAPRDRLAIGRAMWKLMRRRPGDDGNDQSVGRWLAAQGQSSAAVEHFWSVILVSALGEELERASLSAARKVLVDGFLAAREAYVVEIPSAPLATLYGPQLQQWFAAHHVTLHLETPVRRIAGGARPTLTLLDGRQHSADFVVLAVPWHKLADVVPPEVAAAWPWLGEVAAISSAPITGVHLWFDRSITELPHAVLVGRLSQWIFNRGRRADGGNSPEAGATSEPGGHYYQVVISASRQLAGRDRQEIIDEVCRDLAAIWPAAAQAKLLHARVVTEPSAVFSVRPGLDRIRPSQRTPLPELVVAGDWTATSWPATMESAVRSGYLAAEAVLRAAARPERFLVPDLPRGVLSRLLVRSA